MPVPAPGQVVVAVAASGVNFIDIYQRSGVYPVPMPFVPGIEGAGTVIAAAADVVGVAVGDRVGWVNQPGGYAQHVAVTGHRHRADPARAAAGDGRRRTAPGDDRALPAARHLSGAPGRHGAGACGGRWHGTAAHPAGDGGAGPGSSAPSPALRRPNSPGPLVPTRSSATTTPTWRLRCARSPAARGWPRSTTASAARPSTPAWRRFARAAPSPCTARPAARCPRSTRNGSTRPAR